MSGPPHNNRNRSVHAAVRDLVQLALDARGISSTARRESKGLSDSLGDDAVDPDLALVGVDLNVSSKLTHRLAQDLDSVSRGAQIRGVPISAFVQWRADEQIENAYVVTSLASFSKLLRGDHLPPP